MTERVGSRGARLGPSDGSTVAQSDSKVPRRSARRVTPGASQSFVAATEQLDSRTPVVSVMGEVDVTTAQVLEQTLLGVAEDRTGEVIVDLTDCSFLDCRGLRALIATRARLERSDRPLALVLSNPSVLRILQITHCDELFEIYPSLGAAVDGNGDGKGVTALRSRARVPGRAAPG
jgi:anti-sigma B factor antagonist